jgi:Fe-S cluster biogenesis protein NfuA/nitrite reductase/ring-hydroxylating ferredoxin subunit
MDGGATEPAAVGARIASLLESCAVAGPVAAQRAEELVRLVVDLYGAGLERLLDVLADAGRLDDVAARALADDELVASLLLVHGLHPYDVETRIRQALDDVRPYLGSHGGDVALLGVTPEGLVRLQFSGTCGSCPSSGATLELAIEGAVSSAAPETTGIELVSPEPPSGGFVPLTALRIRPSDERAATWVDAPEAAGLPDGVVRGLGVRGAAVVVMRAGADLFAFRDRCAACEGGLAGASLGRALGTRELLLRCPGCGAHFDVRRAGARADGPESRDPDHVEPDHLEPVPLLVREDSVALALPVPVEVPA